MVVLGIAAIGVIVHRVDDGLLPTDPACTSRAASGRSRNDAVAPGCGSATPGRQAQSSGRGRLGIMLIRLHHLREAYLLVMLLTFLSNGFSFLYHTPGSQISNQQILLLQQSHQCKLIKNKYTQYKLIYYDSNFFRENSFLFTVESFTKPRWYNQRPNP